MDIAPVVSVLDFEIYVLVAMKFGTINREARIEAKLADHGFTMYDAEAIAERVAQAHGDESIFFNGLTHGLADADSASVGFTSVLWRSSTLKLLATQTEWFSRRAIDVFGAEPPRLILPRICCLGA